jgi:branched-chain amino acid transport system ATP-binding protein
VHEIFPVLRERARQRVGRMSGGQRQMVAIGRALMTEPSILLLDEPSAGLAPNLQDAVFGMCRRIAETGTPILIVEQNAKKALKASDRGYVLDQGRNAYEGTGEELLADPNVGRLYLGDRPS